MGLLSGLLGGGMAGMGGGGNPMLGLLPMLLQQQGGGGEGGGLLGAFQGNPQFQQQLQGLMNGQGPGSQPVQFTPPITQMTNAAPPMRPGGSAGGMRQDMFPWLRPQVR